MVQDDNFHKKCEKCVKFTICIRLISTLPSHNMTYHCVNMTEDSIENNFTTPAILYSIASLHPVYLWP